MMLTWWIVAFLCSVKATLGQLFWIKDQHDRFLKLLLLCI